MKIEQVCRTQRYGCSYKLYSKTPVTRKFMLVVVKASNEESFIVTAFYTDKVKKGDIIRVLWEKKPVRVWVDKEGDLLEVQLGKPQKGFFKDAGDDAFLKLIPRGILSVLPFSMLVKERRKQKK
ncbi:MAG: hypothetical protein M1540_04340 [Candidatus Bathyarchaeota archaeon]|nr:hypothetical protein [Candidatus Bathyarchaeota archaeon]